MWMLLVALFLSAQPGIGDTGNCWQGDGDAPCWAAVRDLYSAVPIERFPRSDMQVRRVFLHDGTGRIRPGGHGPEAGLLAVERGSDGVAWFSFRPARRAGSANTRLQARLTDADWTEIEAITAGMTGAAPTGGWDGCMHGWDFLVEVADPAGRVVRRRESSCASGAGWALANRLPRLFAAAIPGCGARPAQDGRLNDWVDWLNRCSRRADFIESLR